MSSKAYAEKRTGGFEELNAGVSIGYKFKRKYTDEEIKIMRQQLKEHYPNQRLDPEFETYPDDWCVYSWAEGNMIKACNPRCITIRITRRRSN